MPSRVRLSALLLTALALSGCSSTTPAASTTTTPAPTPATTAPALTLSATALSFSATVGQISAGQTLTLTNSGTATLNLTATIFSDTKDYLGLTSCGATLAAGASCTQSVTFQPQSLGALPATLTFTDNAANSPQVVTLTGTGTAVPLPNATLSPGTLTFASASAGTASAAQTVMLTNSGSATLAGIAVSLAGANPAVFAQTNTCGATLAAAASCTISVVFTPSAASTAYAGSLVITDNSGGVGNSTQTVTLSGAGAAPVVIPEPMAALSTSTLTFATASAGAISAAQAVTLANIGTAPLTGISVAVAGANPSVFAQYNLCPATLAAASSCTIFVTFTPAAASTAYTASLVVTDNSGGTAGATQAVTLTGSGVTPLPTPQAVLSTVSLTFPATLVGSSAASQTVTLSNPGTGSLTGIAVAVSGSSYSMMNGCGTTLVAGGSCGIAVTFTPALTGSQGGTLTVSGSASTLPQTVALTGTGTAPAATFSASSIAFPSTTVSTTSASSSVTLTNSGTGAMTISGIVLGGVNAADFAESSTCTGPLAAGASCIISATFTPAAASTYSASITVTDSASGSPQTIVLSGAGTAASVTHTFYAFPETDLSVTPLYALINAAATSIDMTMYELVDTTFSGDLVAACNRGVKVRVILDQSLEKSSNTAAYNQLNAVTNCSAAWSNTQFQATHEKSFVVDNKTLAILSLNLTSRYYNLTRDFAEISNDPADIAAVEATFNTDYGATADFSYQPRPGTDLIWSPTTATADLLGIINGATKTLLVENEEMSASNIVSALVAACQRGVAVQIAMTDTGSYHSDYAQLDAAGCGVHLYADNASTLYIHGKALVADLGLSTQSVYMGSINFSTDSLTENRELGLYLTDQPSVQALANAIVSDYAGAPKSTY